MGTRYVSFAFACLLAVAMGCGSVPDDPDAGATIDSGGGVIDSGGGAIDATGDPDALVQYDAVPACMGSQAFAYSGVIETFTVPACATSLTIEAFGAQGGGGPTVSGGLGARMRGDFTVVGAEVLQVLVGGQGVDASNDSSEGGGSGGGSFVVRSNNTAVIIAGGGGGALYSLTGVGSEPRELNGGPGQVTTNGQQGDGGGAGGTNGNGGTTWPWTGWHSGTGGGGLLTNANAPSNGSSSFGTPNQPGAGFVNGGAGGAGGSLGRSGGFGGGGAAGFTGGGGGGYSGGGSSTYGDQSPGANTYGGGGGGSINNGGANPQAETGVQAGNGSVVISW